MPARDNDDELIFGKNAVLAYLQQSHDQSNEPNRALSGHEANNSRDSSNSSNLSKSSKSSNSSNSSNKTRVSVNKVYIATGMQHDKRLDLVRGLCRDLKIPVIEAERKKLDLMLPRDQIHQGVIAQVSAAEFVSLDEFLQSLDAERQTATKAGKIDPINTFAVAVLDGIEDPHNLGAIVRVAEASGLKAIILPNRRSAGVTGTVAKTSAGALANMPIVRITNLSNALSKLKDYGFWTAGLSVAADTNFFEADLKRPMAIVIGSEGGGMGRLVEKNCDMLLRIPMLGKTQSLNASVASGIVFYEYVRQQMVN
jgi:23S rRNA (guanosine2251-2'-O)-methyltransferase